jgi:hypothetical protein
MGQTSANPPPLPPERVGVRAIQEQTTAPLLSIGEKSGPPRRDRPTPISPLSLRERVGVRATQEQTTAPLFSIGEKSGPPRWDRPTPISPLSLRERVGVRAEPLQGPTKEPR